MSGPADVSVESCLLTPDGLQLVLVAPAATHPADAAMAAPAPPQITITDIFGRTVPTSVKPQIDAAADTASVRLQVTAPVRANDPYSDSPSYLLTTSLGARTISVWVAPGRPSALAPSDSPAVTQSDDLGPVDYSGRDYDALRAMMRARIAQDVEDNAAWALDHPADPLTTLVEVLAYTGDHLSFRQDAAGTESYLTTARRRLSLRRHARLRDYAVNDGCNARTVVAFTVSAAGVLEAGLAAVTLQPSASGVVLAEGTKLAPSTTVYETMESLSVDPTLNDLGTALVQASAVTILPGTITLTLQGAPPALQPGRLLVLSQTVAPGDTTPAFGAQALRLLVVQPSKNANGDTTATAITWHPEDALARPLTIPPSGAPGAVSLFANVVLADHGHTVAALPHPATVSATGRYRPVVTVEDPVSAAPLPQIAPGFDGTQDVVAASLLVPSAMASLNPDPTTAVIALRMCGSRPLMSGTADTWLPQPDLLSSPATARLFAVVPEDAVGSAPRRLAVQFGEGAMGYPPAPGTEFTASVRSAGGQSGRLLAYALVQVLGPAPLVTAVSNPLPAMPSPAEPDQAIRLFGPSGFRVQLRGVDPTDWERLGKSDPLVRSVTADYGPDGSGPCEVGLTTTTTLPDDNVTFPVASQRLLAYAILGAPPHIEQAKDLAPNIAFAVYCMPGSNVRATRERLLRRVGNGLLPDGAPAYFHPANWPPGRSLVLDDLTSVIQADPAVAFIIAQREVDPRVLFETTETPGGTPTHLRAGRIEVSPWQRIRLGNDPFRPQDGTMGLFVVASP